MANTLSTTAKLEAVLFAAGKPLSFKKLAELTQASVAEVAKELENLQTTYLAQAHGLEVIVNQGEAALATHPQLSDLVAEFLKAEEYGELTRPQLEALSVIAYRGPISKAELEQIRGVNCSIILRNLMIRGLVQSVSEESLVPRYQVTVDFLAHLGLTKVTDLPSYSDLAKAEGFAQVAGSVPPLASAPEAFTSEGEAT